MDNYTITDEEFDAAFTALAESLGPVASDEAEVDAIFSAHLATLEYA